MLLCVWIGVLASPARASTLGDLDGSSIIDPPDIQLLWSVYGSAAGSPKYDGGGDLNSDQVIDYRDLAILASGMGQFAEYVSPGTPFLTVDFVPDDMNNLLVVPTSGFVVNYTIANPPGAPLIALSTLWVTADRPAGPLVPPTNLAPLFERGQGFGSWHVDAGHPFPPLNVSFLFQVLNERGDLLELPYAVAARNWGIPQPIGPTQKVFLDFGQDRDGIGGNDFDEDLRAFGLGSTASPSLSATVRAEVITRAIARVRAFYGQNADGTPGPDPVTVAFSSTSAAGATRICVGGEDPSGGVTFGLTPFDKNNTQTGTDTCIISPTYGVFPREFLFFAGNANFQATFNPLRPAAGGVPVGEHALDPIVLAPGFDPATAPPDQAARWNVIDVAESTFAQFTATIAAHESGHTLGLTATGAAPGGLWGGTSGGGAYHNMVPGGGAPAQNFLMNSGSTFTYERIVGVAGTALPVIRPLNAAYLRNQLMLKSNISALLPAPTLTSVTPNPAVYSGGTVTITLHGSNFYGVPTVLLKRVGTTPKQVQGITLINPNTVQGTVNQFQAGTGTFDVELTNPDDQAALLTNGLTLQ